MRLSSLPPLARTPTGEDGSHQLGPCDAACAAPDQLTGTASETAGNLPAQAPLPQKAGQTVTPERVCWSLLGSVSEGKHDCFGPPHCLAILVVQAGSWGWCWLQDPQHTRMRPPDPSYPAAESCDRSKRMQEMQSGLGGCLTRWNLVLLMLIVASQFGVCQERPEVRSDTYALGNSRKLLLKG